MDNIDEKEANQFLILCDPFIERLYALQFAEITEEDYSLAFRFTSDPDAFLLQCLRNPPVAGLVDLGSLIRGSTEQMNRLFAFHTRWPVLRSRIDSNGQAEILRMQPPLRGPFHRAVADLAIGGSAWENSSETRLHLRTVVSSRARLRATAGSADADGDREWSRVNITNLSRGGCLVVATHPPAPGTQLEVEILDLPGGSAQLNAEVAWSHEWDDGTDVPRCGLQFLAEPFPETILDALGDQDFVAELC